MLAIDGCRLSYPDFEAHYSLHVPEGELCAVVGPSGGGKTTLLHMIAGFEPLAHGKLTFRGKDLMPLRPADRPVALVFQDHNLFPHLTARQNIALGIRPSLRLNADDESRIAAALRALDIVPLADRLPGAMSGGQRQRVALARALVADKPLLLLDEAFGGLDPGLRQEMIAWVDQLRKERGLTVLMTIHTPDDVRDVASRMAFVADGRVIADGAASMVLDPERDRRIAAFLGWKRARSARSNRGSDSG